ncbi:putative ubiquitin-specific processing protease 21 [Gigaspora margarita]|uniref:Putative ubiquitin-specific processing protease 21 n=1 Tax=Gigaspora margarita TaxID=4874 RepID=A0A8H4B2D3_GIGMA|nr:putative ubiquitin-specific processing protease 21 [Gigaspora margarita]
MPDPGYEIEDFQYYTWRITGWSGLEKRITSPEFEAGGTVSIYLDFDNLKEAPAGWHSCVQFALLLWNPEDQTSYVSHHVNHRFTAEESDCGFTRFYDLRKLFAPSENRIRPLIENDACNITALVHIIKDPTGFLWHDFKNNLDFQLSIHHQIVIPQIFAQHQGFDLVNFDDRRYPLSAIPQFKVLKSETYRNFKCMAAKRFGYSAEQIRLWVIVNRRNKTVRPDILLKDNFLDMTIEKIYTKITTKKTYTPKQNELKFFLEVVDKPTIGIEIKSNMIEEMKLNLTFQQSEIQDGDIICFQKSLTDKE